MKICKKCGGSEFYKNNKCKACKKIQDKLYREKNKDIEYARKKRWRDNNIEKEREKNKIKYQKHREWYILAKNKRRARLLEARGSISKGIIEKLYHLQNGKCVCCGQSLGNNFHVDHIMPLALGGDNCDSNLQLLRSRCNREKHSKHPIDFMQSRGYLL